MVQNETEKFDFSSTRRGVIVPRPRIFRYAPCPSGADARPKGWEKLKNAAGERGGVRVIGLRGIYRVPERGPTRPRGNRTEHKGDFEFFPLPCPRSRTRIDPAVVRRSSARRCCLNSESNSPCVSGSLLCFTKTHGRFCRKKCFFPLRILWVFVTP